MRSSYELLCVLGTVILLTSCLCTMAEVVPLVSIVNTSSDQPDSISEAASAAVFQRVPAEEAQNRLLQWMALLKVDEPTARKVTSLWADKSEIQQLSAEEVLDRLVDSFALVDTGVNSLVESVRSSKPHQPLSFEGVKSAPFFRDQVQLYQARWLTQHRYFDEAIFILEQLDPQAVVDPASFFFYRAVCRLRLLKPAEAGDDIQLLLNNTLDVPPRFRAVAELMKEEADLSTEGLPQVARLMSDVQRRLDLGRADDPVQKREEEVIAALDKLLKEMEQQQQQQQQQQSGQGGSGQQQTQPGQQGAAESMIQGSQGQGEADRKELTENGSWGMLDKQAEAQARELIRQQFPSNFLDAISRYTRRIAEQKK